MVLRSDPIDFRIYLTAAEFKARVLGSRAWHEYRALPPIPDFDEAALVEIEDRNELRAANQLPPLDVKIEIAKLRDAYEERTFGSRFHALCVDCITEIYGLLTPKDFNSHSGMLAFVASKKSLIYDLIEGGASKRGK